MRLNIKNALVVLILAPCTALAMPVGGYFQQGVVPALTNTEVPTGRELNAAFASDQLTNGAGQTFSHTYSIHSASNFALICTVTSNIVISTSGMSMNKPSSSDEGHCKTSNSMSSGNGGMVLATEIIVS
jgi:hypothetical protein